MHRFGLAASTPILDHSRFTSTFGDLERFDLREFQNRLSPLWTDGMGNAIRKWLVTPHMSGAGCEKASAKVSNRGSVVDAL